METIASMFLILLGAGVILWLVWPRERIPEGGRFVPERAAVLEALQMHKDMAKGEPLKKPSIHLLRCWPKTLCFLHGRPDREAESAGLIIPGFPAAVGVMDKPAGQVERKLYRPEDADFFYAYLAKRWPQFVHMERMRKDVMAAQFTAGAVIEESGVSIHQRTSKDVLV